jgi:N-acyl homoserine lactone hydrolase
METADLEGVDMKHEAVRWAGVSAVAAMLLAVPPVFAAGQVTPSPARRPVAPPSVRLYVFDCGTLHIADTGRFRLKKEEVPTSDLSVACFLVAHPRGTLIWDTGAVPDTAWTETGAPVKHHVVLPDSQQRDLTLRKTLSSQLAELGYAPGDITYLALSHYHYDHTANANAFAGATWLVRKVERDAMFADKPPGVTLPSSYASLRDSKTVLIEKADHDVFGDGTVVIKSAPGHTPGHQVLYVKLAKTGGVVLSGDLYHYAASRTLRRLPTFDFDQEQSAVSRAAIEGFLEKARAQLWIQHDVAGNAQLKKAPAFYE